MPVAEKAPVDMWDGILELKAEIKELSEDGTFKGIASAYGIVDRTDDVIDKGAFTKTLNDSPNRVILWQHDSKLPIGEGVLKEWQGKILIDGTLDIGDDPVAQNAYRKMKSGRVRGLSIGFFTRKQAFEEEDGKFIRHIKELELVEVSVVTFPALKEAQITRVKNADLDSVNQKLQELRDEIAARDETIKALQATQVAIPPKDPAQADESHQQQTTEPNCHSGLAVQLAAARRMFNA